MSTGYRWIRFMKGFTTKTRVEFLIDGLGIVEVGKAFDISRDRIDVCSTRLVDVIARFPFQVPRPLTIESKHMGEGTDLAIGCRWGVGTSRTRSDNHITGIVLGIGAPFAKPA